jgi:hypothetical protein
MVGTSSHHQKTPPGARRHRGRRIDGGRAMLSAGMVSASTNQAAARSLMAPAMVAAAQSDGRARHHDADQVWIFAREIWAEDLVESPARRIATW